MAPRAFIHEDFLLDTVEARELYHGYAEGLPIIDYHCHLPPADIALDRRWANLTQVWLYGDHYKWRQMRTAGIAERYCTGGATDREKFDQYARLMPMALRNPLYHWSHLELKTYFGISDRLLSPETADSIWNDACEVMARPAFSARGLMLQSKVEVVCTTDDPVDTLEHHQAIAREASLASRPAGAAFPVQVRPTWRPDKCWMIGAPAVFNPWVELLGQRTGLDLSTLDAFMAALRVRHDFFHACGCRLSDRGVSFVPAEDCTPGMAAALYAKARSGQPVSPEEALAFMSYMMHELAVMDAEKGWTMQIHYGVLRNNNTRLFQQLGPDTGFDSIGDWPVAASLVKHLDRLDRCGKLPKTILYNINPCDNELIATLIGNFQDGITPGKLQFGSGWWFLDQLDGMTRQIEALSQLGLLGCFVGMLTDSRSFLSYTRHEYFRRLLCRILGEDMARGRLPGDLRLVGGLVADVSYHNARRYFGFYSDGSTGIKEGARNGQA